MSASYHSPSTRGRDTNGIRTRTAIAEGHGHKAEERERLLDHHACVLTCVRMRVRGRCERPGRGARAAHPYEEKPISTRSKSMSKVPSLKAEKEVDLAPIWWLENVGAIKPAESGVYP